MLFWMEEIFSSRSCSMRSRRLRSIFRLASSAAGAVLPLPLPLLLPMPAVSPAAKDLKELMTVPAVRGLTVVAAVVGLVSTLPPDILFVGNGAGNGNSGGEED